MSLQKYTKDDVFHDVGVILLNEATKISWLSGRKASAEFLMVPEDSLGIPHEEIDYSKFEIFNLVNTAWGYVEGDFIEHAGGVQDEAIEWECFLNAYFPRVREYEIADAFSCEVHVPIGSMNGSLEKLFRKALAKWKIADGYSIQDDELALLADVNIRTVKNAISAKGKDNLIADRHVTDSGLVVFKIENENALNWLEGRRGYVPIFGAGTPERYANTYLANCKSASDLGVVIYDTHHLNFEDEDCPNPDLYKDWDKKGFTPDLELTKWVAEKLSLDFPLLAGKILEFNLRNELNLKKEEKE